MSTHSAVVTALARAHRWRHGLELLESMPVAYDVPAKLLLIKLQSALGRYEAALAVRQGADDCRSI